MDLAAEGMTEKASFLYDAIAYVPTRIKNEGPDLSSRRWKYTLTPVNERLDYSRFMARIVDVARLRGFLAGTPAT